MREHARKCKYLLNSLCECDCDGYHTFDELYEHRTALFIALCRKLYRLENAFSPSFGVWRSKLHHDGTMYDDMFILGAGFSPGTQITYHLDMDRWDETDFAETLCRAPKFDGHTSDDVLKRLKRI